MYENPSSKLYRVIRSDGISMIISATSAFDALYTAAETQGWGDLEWSKYTFNVVRLP